MARLESSGAACPHLPGPFLLQEAHLTPEVHFWKREGSSPQTHFNASQREGGEAEMHSSAVAGLAGTQRYPTTPSPGAQSGDQKPSVFAHVA